MTDFKNKTALITGGAEGIGLSIAKSLGAQGMNIVLTDIDTDMLAKAEQGLKDAGVSVLSAELDVVKPEQWTEALDKAEQEFGKIHMLVSNAGVSAKPGPLEATNLEDWRWVMDVNLMGVVQGAAAVVPRIKKHDEGGWIINVASMAGMMGVPFAGSYTASKVAVVGMSEAWYAELKKQNIKVSVLCPGFVKTRIHLSARNRQDEYGGRPPVDFDNVKNTPGGEFVENGIDVNIVGDRVVEALQAGELYIYTHPSYADMVAGRAENVGQAFARAAQSPHLKDVPPEDPVFG